METSDLARNLVTPERVRLLFQIVSYGRTREPPQIWREEWFVVCKLHRAKFALAQRLNDEIDSIGERLPRFVF